MTNIPEGVYALDAQQKLELAMALMARKRRAEDGKHAFQAAYPEVPEEMARTAAHHVFNDGPPALIAFLADAELFLRDPAHRMHMGVTHEALYHIYNWMQFSELLPDGRKNVLELLKELKQFVEEDDRAAIVATATELEDALDGSRDYPRFE
jgi:hypothetical protein